MPRNRNTPSWDEGLFVVGFGEGSGIVYQLLDHEGTPIYIGSTNSLDNRIARHRAEKPWFHEVKGVWFERVLHRFGGYADNAYNREYALIQKFKPKYNGKQGRAPRFQEPTFGMTVIVPLEHRNQLMMIAASRGVGPADLMREAIADWLNSNAMPDTEADSA